MGQYEVYQCFKQKPRKWWSSKEIAKILNAEKNVTSVALQKLRRSQFIYRKYIKDEKNKSIAHFKIVPKNKYIKFAWKDGDKLSSVDGHAYYI